MPKENMFKVVALSHRGLKMVMMKRWMKLLRKKLKWMRNSTPRVTAVVFCEMVMAEFKQTCLSWIPNFLRSRCSHATNGSHLLSSI